MLCSGSPTACGSVSSSGLLSISSSCREASVTITANALLTGLTVSNTVGVSVVWLASFSLRAFYDDGSTEYMHDELRYMYVCAGVPSSYHTLHLKAWHSIHSIA